MGKIYAKDIPKIKIEHSFYMVNIKHKFSDMQTAQKFLDKINDVLRYLLKGTGVSAIIGVSEMDSKDIGWRKIKTGKSGRPRVVAAGGKKRPHIHLVMYGEKVCTYAIKACKRINRLARKNGIDYAIATARKSTLDGSVSSCVGYLIRQSSYKRTIGKFDFVELAGKNGDNFYFEDYG